MKEPTLQLTMAETRTCQLVIMRSEPRFYWGMVVRYQIQLLPPRLVFILATGKRWHWEPPVVLNIWTPCQISPGITTVTLTVCIMVSCATCTPLVYLLSLCLPSQFQSKISLDAIRHLYQFKRTGFHNVNANGVIPRPNFYRWRTDAKTTANTWCDLWWRTDAKATRNRDIYP